MRSSLQVIVITVLVVGAAFVYQRHDEVKRLLSRAPTVIGEALTPKRIEQRVHADSFSYSRSPNSTPNQTSATQLKEEDEVRNKPSPVTQSAPTTDETDSQSTIHLSTQIRL